MLLRHEHPDAKVVWEKENSAGPNLNPEPTNPNFVRPKRDQMSSSPDSAPSERGSVGACKTKGIPGESEKLLGWKVIKG